MESLNIRWKLLARMGLLVWMAILFWPTNTAGQEQGPYHGLKDQRMVQQLKSFPRKANRWNVPPEDGRLLYDLIARKIKEEGQ